MKTQIKLTKKHFVTPNEQEAGNIKITSPEYQEARKAALQVSFIETIEEFRLYTKAVYEALIWARGKPVKAVKSATAGGFCRSGKAGKRSRKGRAGKQEMK